MGSQCKFVTAPLWPWCDDLTIKRPLGLGPDAAHPCGQFGRRRRQQLRAGLEHRVDKPLVNAATEIGTLSGMGQAVRAISAGDVLSSPKTATQ